MSRTKTAHHLRAPFKHCCPYLGFAELIDLSKALRLYMHFTEVVTVCLLFLSSCEYRK